MEEMGVVYYNRGHWEGRGVVEVTRGGKQCGELISLTILISGCFSHGVHC